MAAGAAVMAVGRRVLLGAAQRRALWGGFRKKEEELDIEKIVEPEEKEPSLRVPPPRSRNYVPPANLQSNLEILVKEIFGPSVPENWQQTSLKENRLKFLLLDQLASELGHTVPNSQLHLMCSAADVLKFYSTPVKDVSKFDELCAAELPPNLKIVWEQ